MAIFAEDGIWEGKGLWRAQGHADIRKLAKSFAERISFSQHNVFNPRIEVNGNAAHGRWNFLGPFTFRKGNRQIWLAAFYEDDFVKDDGVWKFQHFRALVRMTAPYEEGWASKPKWTCSPISADRRGDAGTDKTYQRVARRQTGAILR